jgi:hypothetical protein
MKWLRLLCGSEGSSLITTVVATAMTLLCLFMVTVSARAIVTAVEVQSLADRAVAAAAAAYAESPALAIAEGNDILGQYTSEAQWTISSHAVNLSLNVEVNLPILGQIGHYVHAQAVPV